MSDKAIIVTLSLVCVLSLAVATPFIMKHRGDASIPPQAAVATPPPTPVRVIPANPKPRPVPSIDQTAIIRKMESDNAAMAARIRELESTPPQPGHPAPTRKQILADAAKFPPGIYRVPYKYGGNAAMIRATGLADLLRQVENMRFPILIEYDGDGNAHYDDISLFQADAAAQPTK